MPGVEVKKGTETTLTCSLTELDAEVTISWYLDGTGPIQTVAGGEYSARKLRMMSTSQ